MKSLNEYAAKKKYIAECRGWIHGIRGRIRYGGVKKYDPNKNPITKEWFESMILQLAETQQL